MSIATTRTQRRMLLKANRKLPPTLQEMPRAAWPTSNLPPGLKRVWRSSDFLVQQFEVDGAPVRLSINRAVMGLAGRWKDGITWDDIQRLKREAGYSDRFAVEIYPADFDIVDVANVRHIWLLDEPPAFAWRRDA